jgi:hypothetical protein
MNWEAISAIGEVIGAAAVVITLVYLAIQIRQGNQTNASVIRQSFYDYTTRQMLQGVESTDFNALLGRAMMTDEDLTSGERVQLLRFFQAVFVGYQGAYFQHRHKALNDDDWNMCRNLLRSFWLLPGKEVARQWEQFKAGGFLDDGFVRECEALKADAEQYLRGLEEKDLAFRE